MDRWRNRVALVTGASSGIGAAVCRMLSAEGLRVVGCARRVEKIEEMAKECSNVRPYKCDMKDEDAIRKMFEWIENDPDLGRVDLCINNAGVMTNTSFMDGTVKEWKEMLDVNVIALCLCTQLSVKSMMKHKIDDGQIILLSSLSGHRVLPTVKFYAASKFAVRALLEGWRQEIRQLGDTNIRISCISPGLVGTDMPVGAGILDSYSTKEDVDEGATWSGSHLMTEDVAGHVRHVLEMPKHVEIHDILVRPTKQKT